jgi:hypothetical protein
MTNLLFDIGCAAGRMASRRTLSYGSTSRCAHEFSNVGSFFSSRWVGIFGISARVTQRVDVDQPCDELSADGFQAA